MYSQCVRDNNRCVLKGAVTMERWILPEMKNVSMS